MRQEALPRCTARGRAFIDFPGRALGPQSCQLPHQPRRKAKRQRLRLETEHRRDKHGCIWCDASFGQRTQDKMPAHAVAHHDMRPRHPRLPIREKRRQIVNPDAEIEAMANMRIRRHPPRSSLAAPVERGDIPSFAMPMVKQFEIFFDDIAASALKQDRSAGFTFRQPFKTAQGPAVARRHALKP